MIYFRHLRALSSAARRRTTPPLYVAQGAALALCDARTRRLWWRAARSPAGDLHGTGLAVAQVLELRLRLEDVAAELLDPELFALLERADRVLAPKAGAALLAIDPADYEDLAGLGLIPGHWTSAREAAHAEASGVDALLRDAAAGGWL